MEIFIGMTGAALVLLAFILNEVHVWSDDDLSYDVVNFLGASLLIWYSWLIQSWPFAFLNAIWMAVALRDVVMDLRRKR